MPNHVFKPRDFLYVCSGLDGWPKRGRVLKKLNDYELRYEVLYESSLVGQPLAEICFKTEAEALVWLRGRLMNRAKAINERLAKLGRIQDVRGSEG